MATKAGVHITTGSRNGYGLVASAVPAVVLTTTDGLDEVKGYGGDRTITIYRPIGLYGHPDGPELLRQGAGTPERARALADELWPTLLAACQRKEADYYQLTNEIGGGSEGPTRALIAYETRLMELAEQEGLHLIIGGQAGGTPGDWELWKELFVPFLRRAAQGRHIYGRHAYGGLEPDGNGMLTKIENGAIAPADWNAGRPFQEAEYLREIGVNTPMVITEAGQNGGYDFPGVEPFINDVANYDVLCRAHENIWGFCLWTYGEFENANIAPASQALADYIQLQDGASTPVWPSWGEGDNDAGRGQPRIQYRRRYRLYHPNLSVQEALDDARKLAEAGERPTFGWAADDAGIGDLEERIVELVGCPADEQPVWQAWYDEHYPGVVLVFVGNDNDVTFAFTHWPTDHKTITQAFGNNPGYYGQWGLPGHEGIDIRSRFDPIYAVADGTVAEAGRDNDYGNFVIIRHPEGYRTWYAHLSQINIVKGQVVSGGQRLGNGGDTGNSEGAHLHLRLDRPGYTYIDKAGNIWPRDIHDPTPFLAPLMAEDPIDPPPTGSPVAMGPHGPADPGRMTAAQIEVWARARPTALKFLSAHSGESIAAVSGRFPNAPAIVRAFAKFVDNAGQLRQVPPADFVNWTLPDLIRAIQALDNREVWVELHNEPNLVEEGMWHSWADGAEFGDWLSEVLRQYKATLPGHVKYLFPGLSPGPAIGGRRYHWLTFLDEARQAVLACDGAGAHSYWNADYSLENAVGDVGKVALKFTSLPVWVTEASHNGPGATPQEKGQQYIEFARRVGMWGGVRGVLYFVLSASSGFEHEVWVRNGQSVGIAEVVGNR